MAGVIASQKQLLRLPVGTADRNNFVFDLKSIEEANAAGSKSEKVQDKYAHTQGERDARTAGRAKAMTLWRLGTIRDALAVLSKLYYKAAKL